jgi:serine/threonine protein kinase
VAPEVLADNAQIGHGKTVDWWGYGVLLHLLLTQQAPFWSDNNDELFAMIKEGDPPDFTQYSFLDNDTVSLLSQLLERDPTKVCSLFLALSLLFSMVFFFSLLFNGVFLLASLQWCFSPLLFFPILFFFHG